MTFSAALVVAIGGDEGEFHRRSAAIDRIPDELRKQGIAGVLAEATEAMERWQQAGADRLYLQVLDLDDLDHLDLIASVASLDG